MRLRWIFMGLASPALAALALLFVLGAAPASALLLSLAAALTVAALLARVARDKAEEILAYLEALLRGIGDSEPPPAPRSRSGRAAAAALLRLDRAWRSRLAAVSVARSGDDAVLDALHGPLILLDSGRRVVRANRAARALLGPRLADHDLAASIRHPDVLEIVDSVIAGRGEQAARFAWPGASERGFVARATPVAGGGGLYAAMLAIEDVTALERSQQVRNDFIANVSHELRTPLSALLGFVETIRGPARGDPAAQDRFLGIMHSQASRMVRLVNDLLSLSRIEQNQHSRPTGQVEVAGLLRDIAASLEPKAGPRKIEIDIQVEPGLPPALGDRDELIQLFQNLIENAVKYARDGTQVQVRAGFGGEPPFLSISVADQGEGIAREHLPRLTERFYRIDTARSRTLGGTGLGLAIVKHVVNRHRGRLTIESEIGKGSVFTVQLPAAEAAPSVVTEAS